MEWDPGVDCPVWIFNLTDFSSAEGSLLKSPVMCANICASALGNGLGGLCFSTVMP